MNRGRWNRRATPSANDVPHQQSAAIRLLQGTKTELAIPAQLIEDNIFRRLPRTEYTVHCLNLLFEYAEAQGYVDTWGHVIETMVGAHLVWRFVPLDLWASTQAIRKNLTADIPDLITLLQPVVRQCLAPRLPDELVVTGIQHNRRSPHALFGLLLTDVPREAMARRWIAEELLPMLLPALMTRVSVALSRIFAEEHTTPNNNIGFRATQANSQTPTRSEKLS